MYISIEDFPVYKSYHIPHPLFNYAAANGSDENWQTSICLFDSPTPYKQLSQSFPVVVVFFCHKFYQYHRTLAHNSSVDRKAKSTKV